MRHILNPAESGFYVPSWNPTQPSDAEETLLQQLTPGFTLPCKKTGVMIARIPYVEQAFVQTALTRRLEALKRELLMIADVGDGLIFFQLLRKCKNSQITFISHLLRVFAP